MEIRIEYLPEYTKKIKQLTNELLDTQDKYEAVAPIDDVMELHKALGGLKTVLENMTLD